MGHYILFLRKQIFYIVSTESIMLLWGDDLISDVTY